MEKERYSSDGKIHDLQRLKELQALPLWRKIQITQARIIEWYNYYEGQVYISFSGGKDSTVLLDLGSAFALNKKIVIVNLNDVTITENKSFSNMIREWASRD